MHKSLKFIFLSLLALAILWFFGRNLDWNEVSASVAKANGWYIALAVFIICIGFFIRAIRWKILLQPITDSSLKELFATTTVGFAAVFLVGRLGEIVRPMWLPMRDPRVRPSAALVTIGLERIFDFASLICFFAFNLIWFHAPSGKEAEYTSVKSIGVLLFAAVFAGFVGLFVYKRTSDWWITLFERLLSVRFVPLKIRSMILSLMQQLADSLKILESPREVFLVSFWTFLLWLCIAIPTWLVMVAFDLPTGLTDAFFVLGWSSLGSLVPTPGGAAGAFHAATAGGLIFLNVDKDLAAGVSIIMHLVHFGPALIFGVYYFVRGDISIKGFRSLLSREHAVEEIEHDTEG